MEDLADYVRASRAVQEMVSERARASAALADGLANVERLKAAVTLIQARGPPPCRTVPGDSCPACPFLSSRATQQHRPRSEQSSRQSLGTRRRGGGARCGGALGTM